MSAAESPSLLLQRAAELIVAWLREGARRAESGGWLSEPVLVAALDFARQVLGLPSRDEEE